MATVVSESRQQVPDSPDTSRRWRLRSGELRWYSSAPLPGAGASALSVQRVVGVLGGCTGSAGLPRGDGRNVPARSTHTTAVLLAAVATAAQQHLRAASRAEEKARGVRHWKHRDEVGRSTKHSKLQAPHVVKPPTLGTGPGSATWLPCSVARRRAAQSAPRKSAVSPPELRAS